jgi:hypothetical protein
VEKIESLENYTRNEWKRYIITLETSGEDINLHSKRVEKKLIYTRNECNFSRFNSNNFPLCAQYGMWLERMLNSENYVSLIVTFCQNFTLETSVVFYGEKNTLETSGEDVKTTLETSVFLETYEIRELNSKYTRFECSFEKLSRVLDLFGDFLKIAKNNKNKMIVKTTLVSSVFLNLLHSFRVYFSIFSARFECIFSENC